MSSSNSLQNPTVSSSSLALPSLAILADPPIRHIDGAAMDYFLIELVNTLRVSSAVAAARTKNIEQEMIDADLIPPVSAPPPSKKENQRDSQISVGSPSFTGKQRDSNDEEAVRTRLEAIGLHVGANFTERCV
jgi:hypothetical protein